VELLIQVHHATLLLLISIKIARCSDLCVVA
jgi:hypothetical protein